MARARPEFRWESFGSVIKELLPIVRQHWIETEPHNDISPIDPDFDGYFALERQGGLHIMVARDEGRIVGAHSWLVQTTLRRKSVFTAISDLLIVVPSARSGWLGYKLLTEPEQGLRDLGARFAFCAPASHYDIDLLLKRAGYVQTGHCFEKDLNHGRVDQQRREHLPVPEHGYRRG